MNTVSNAASSEGADGKRENLEPNNRAQWVLPERTLARLPWLVAAVAGLQTIYLLLLSTEELAERGVMIDDAYLYAVLARNFPSLGFLSFDGESATNGVQPLWQLLLVASEYLTPGQDRVRWGMGLSWTLYLAFAALITRWLSRELGVRSVLAQSCFAALVTLNPRFQRVVLQGLETPLLLVLFVLWLLQLTALFARGTARHERDAKSAGSERWPVLGLGLTNAALLLSRTDWWVAAVVGAGVVWLATRQLRSLFAFSAAFSLPVAPYVAYNVVVYGHPVPISARMKLFQMHALFPSLWKYLTSYEWHGLFALVRDVFGLWHIALAMVFMLFVVRLCWLRVRAAGLTSVPRAGLLLGCAVSLHTLFMYVGYRELRPYTHYYFCGELIALAAAVSLLLERVALPSRLQTQFGRWLVVACAVGFVLGRGLLPPKVERWRLRVELGKALATLPQDAKVGAFWPGALAHFAERPVFALDGVVGSARYFLDVVTTGRELDYARENGIEYVAVYHAPPELIEAAAPPKIEDWSMLAELRLWESCGYLRGVAMEQSTGKEQWRVYRLARDWDPNAPCPNRGPRS